MTARNPGLRDLCIAAYGKRSAAKLARKLGVSRSAVCGHWHRAKRAGEIKPPVPMTPERRAYAGKLHRCGIKGEAFREAMELHQ
jgi:hypothetical protein